MWKNSEPLLFTEGGERKTVVTAGAVGLLTISAT
jgi:hypothetical protein